MTFGWMDVPSLATATVLLLSGLPKITDPRPIATTLESLYHQITERWFRRGGSSVDLTRLGRMVGLVETAVAAWVVLGPSWASAAALTLLATGFAVAGLIGASSNLKVACACFGRHGRPLGYSHALLFPVWAGAAWSVAQTGGPSWSDERLVAFASCVACVSCVYVLRMWTAVLPLSRERRRAAMRVGTVQRVAHGGAE